MYQGKFSNPRGEAPVAVETPPAEQTPVEIQENMEPLSPAQAQIPVAQEAPAAVETAAPKKKKKKIRKGAVVFYSIYTALTAIAVAAILVLLIPLNNWLVKYEASQPQTKSEEVFAQLFADPDWAALYEQAGMTDTAFEGKAAFASYMENKLGSDQLSYMETAAGLSGDRKYVVRHGEEKIASYTLTGGTDSKTQIATWTLDKVELFVTRQESVTVEKLPGQTVYVNGVALDDSYTVRKVLTKAEDYLPDGVHGYRLEQQQVEGLLVKPAVEVKDENGETVETQVLESGVITVPVQQQQITDQQEQVAVSAAKASALFAIRAIGSAELRKYYDSTSQIYKDTCATVAFMQDYNGYVFNESATKVTEYYGYSDELFSAKVELKLNVTRTNGTVKVYESEVTYFFTKLSDGNFYVTDSTNIPVQEQVEQVRLSFVTDSGTDHQFVDASTKTVFLPQVQPEAGQVLAGWAVRQDNVMNMVFTPGEDGIVHLSGEEPLEPMVLYPVFEKEN